MYIKTFLIGMLVATSLLKGMEAPATQEQSEISSLEKESILPLAALVIRSLAETFVSNDNYWRNNTTQEHVISQWLVDNHWPCVDDEACASYNPLLPELRRSVVITTIALGSRYTGDLKLAWKATWLATACLNGFDPILLYNPDVRLKDIAALGNQNDKYLQGIVSATKKKYDGHKPIEERVWHALNIEQESIDSSKLKKRYPVLYGPVLYAGICSFSSIYNNLLFYASQKDKDNPSDHCTASCCDSKNCWQRGGRSGREVVSEKFNVWWAAAVKFDKPNYWDLDRKHGEFVKAKKRHEIGRCLALVCMGIKRRFFYSLPSIKETEWVKKKFVPADPLSNEIRCTPADDNYRSVYILKNSQRPFESSKFLNDCQKIALIKELERLILKKPTRISFNGRRFPKFLKKAIVEITSRYRHVGKKMGLSDGELAILESLNLSEHDNVEKVINRLNIDEYLNDEQETLEVVLKILGVDDFYKDCSGNFIFAILPKHVKQQITQKLIELAEESSKNAAIIYNTRFPCLPSSTQNDLVLYGLDYNQDILKNIPLFCPNYTHKLKKNLLKRLLEECPIVLDDEGIINVFMRRYYKYHCFSRSFWSKRKSKGKDEGLREPYPLSELVEVVLERMTSNSKLRRPLMSYLIRILKDGDPALIKGKFKTGRISILNKQNINRGKSMMTKKETREYVEMSLLIPALTKEWEEVNKLLENNEKKIISNKTICEILSLRPPSDIALKLQALKREREDAGDILKNGWLPCLHFKRFVSAPPLMNASTETSSLPSFWKKGLLGSMFVVPLIMSIFK